MPQTATKIEAIADKLPKVQGYQLGDHGYLSFCISDAVRKINQFYEGTGVKPPSKRTIEDWFYKNKFPGWAIAVLKK